MSQFKGRFKVPLFQYILVVLLAVCMAVNYIIFVFPNHFAPAGINGMVTMIQYVFHFSVGYLSLIVNIPMLIVSFWILDRRYAFRTFTFVFVFSVAVLILQKLDFSGIAFQAKDQGEALMAAIVAGLFNGAIYSICVRLGGSTGGTDIIAAFIHRKFPEYDTVWLIFIINVAVAGISFFVYGRNYSSVILCIVYVFTNRRISDFILRGNSSATKFEVITAQPEELSAELLSTLHHGCTVMPAQGMYTHKKLSMLICVVNRRQIVEFETIIRKYSGTFAYISTVNGIIGNFRKIK